MQNVDIQVEGDKIVITIDASKNLGPSRSGKTTMVATTSGNQVVATKSGQVVIGLNVYKHKAL